MLAQAAHRSLASQRGAAFLLLVITLVVGAAAVFYGISRPSGLDTEKDRKTAEALTLAKTALIGYAVSAAIDYSASSIRPGDLPCPDRTDSGNGGASCGSAAGSQQARRIGRLPWRTLGLPDLRDGDGERLWYAVSNNFKNNTRTACTAAAPEATTCLNSDTRGTITVRDTAGNIVHDAANTDPASSGVIAVIFSPGTVLRRQGASVVQNRACVVGTHPTECTLAGICNSTAAPKCNPTNYLDIFGAEDNASFADGTTDGFVNGVIRDASGNVIVNDRLIVIRYQDLIPELEKRVTGEISKCLSLYAQENFSRYPWAAPVATVTTPFEGGINTVFGRVPDNPLWTTKYGAVPVASPPTSAVDLAFAAACTATPNQCMTSQWPIGCNLPNNPTANSWWNNWKLHVFYGVADAYKPQIVYTQPTPSTVSLGTVAVPAGCPSCLAVTPPSTAADKQFVVIAAGKRLPGVAGGQPRTSTTNRRTFANYLEGENSNTDTLFTKQPSGTIFNDMVLYK